MNESEKIIGLRDEAIKSLVIFLKGKDNSPAILRRAGIAGSALASWSRVYAADSGRQATMVTLATALAKDREQLKEYIRVSLPESPLMKRLKA